MERRSAATGSRTKGNIHTDTDNAAGRYRYVSKEKTDRKISPISSISSLFSSFAWSRFCLMICSFFVLVQILSWTLDNGAGYDSSSSQNQNLRNKNQDTFDLHKEPDSEVPYFLDVNGIKAQVLKPSWNCSRLMNVYLKRIRRYNKRTNAVVQLLTRKRIASAALKLDNLVSNIQDYPLFCVPILVKDNIAIKGLVNAAGSIVMEQGLAVSKKDATTITRLRNAGGIILGKANMDEFALGFRTLSSRGGQTTNVFDSSRYPGGSSGGSAVSVASGFAVIGVGTDTGGSVRLPSAFAGLVGIRPTVGLVPVENVVPLSHSRDTVGFMADSVHDVAVSLEIATSSEVKFSTKCTGGNLNKRFNIGLLRFLFPEQEPQLETLNQAISKLNDEENVKIVAIDDEDLQKQFRSLSKYKSTSTFEFENDLRDYLSHWESINDRELTLANIAVETIEKCSRISPDECKLISKSIHKKIHKDGKLTRKEAASYEQLITTVTDRLQKTVKSLMKKRNLDALVYPTFKFLPDKISKGKQTYCGNNRLAPALTWPAISIPFGYSKVGNIRFPQSMDILGPAYSECTLFEIASAIEKQLALKRPLPFFLQQPITT